MKTDADFWSQPAKGLGGEHAPASIEDLFGKEAELGVTLPRRYKHYMLEQNGGQVRRSSYFDGNGYCELFVNDAGLSSLPHVQSFASHLAVSMSTQEGIAASRGQTYWHPERLVILSPLWGDGMVCLDYGWLQAAPVSTPAVIVLQKDPASPFEYAEIKRIATFDEFVDGLVHAGDEAGPFYLGASSPLAMSGMAGALQDITGATLECREDDRYGWFDFDRYYTGRSEHFAEPLVLFITLTPNRHRSGTWLFQSRPDTDFIVHVEPRDRKLAPVLEDISTPMTRLAASLEKRTGATTERLLCPHPFEWCR